VSSPRVVVLAPNWLGDAVMALPAIGSVRHHFKVPLAIAARESVAPLFRAVPGVEEVVCLSRDGGWPPWRGVASNAAFLAASNFDVALLLPNSFHSAWLVYKARISERWGYRTCWRGPLLTRKASPPVTFVHQAAYYLQLVEALGIEPAKLAVVLSAPDEAVARATELLAHHGVAPDERLVGFAPGAAYGRAKQWPPGRIAEVITILADRTGARALVVGSAGDRAAFEAIERALGAAGRTDVAKAYIDMVGRTDLPLLMGLLSRCAAFVSNDSGAMHLAAALGVPTVAIFGPTNEHGTAPLPQFVANGDAGGADRPCSGAGVVILSHAVDCRPCMLRECPIDHRCMTGIGADAVYSAVRGLLEDHGTSLTRNDVVPDVRPT
jgi:heptosyltransferase II